MRTRICTVLRATWLAATLALPGLAGAMDKMTVLDEIPPTQGKFEVAPDGRRLYFAGTKFAVYDDQGHLIEQIGTDSQAGPRNLIPLPGGGFVSCASGFHGSLTMCLADGTETSVRVSKGSEESKLHNGSTGWTSPVCAAADPGRRLIFAVDSTLVPDSPIIPAWSRIAVFDFDGKYRGDINRFDEKAPDAAARDESRRTWYTDIEVDPKRRRVYVLALQLKAILAFSYEGKPEGRADAPADGGLAVLPDGRVAVGGGGEVLLFSPDLKPIGKLPIPAGANPGNGSVLDLEVDAAGRLYASMSNKDVLFVRWTADLKRAEVVGPRYLRLQVDFPGGVSTAGKPLTLKATATGRPALPKSPRWHAWARPADGSDLRWRALDVNYQGDSLRVDMPRDLSGLVDLAVRVGDGPIDRAARGNDPYLEKTVAVLPEKASQCVVAIPTAGRRAFRQGEEVALQVVRRGEKPGGARVRLSLGRAGVEVASADVTTTGNLGVAIPAALTRRLAPGRYQLGASAPKHEGYALDLMIAPAEPDSPMQRLLYHEMDDHPATEAQPELDGMSERLAFVRDYTRTASALGFTRMTDRLLQHTNHSTGPAAWPRGKAPADLADPGFAPAEFYAVPEGPSQWEAEAFLDRAVASGLHYDSQLLLHCAGVHFRDERLRQVVPILQRGLQWLRRYPSFYGVNYNDELFFANWAQDWSPEDEDWLKKLQAEKFPNRPRAEVCFFATTRMYDAFRSATEQADPDARKTCAPMWQFSAVQGSYNPVNYRGMSETYTHYISEGYAIPWYPAHAAEFLRRPGLPLMGVFDYGLQLAVDDLYNKDGMQVAARGAQGIGVQHARPFKNARDADAFRTTNWIAKLYGPTFAEAPPANEGAVLYSLSQDLTEQYHVMGTPHWERVYALTSAGLMAGVPLEIAYEEDVAAGRLMDGKRPRIPMLFLVGQQQPLPPAVREAIAGFVAAGGKVFTDAESAPFPKARALPLKTFEVGPLFPLAFNGEAAFPLFQPALEKLAAELASAVGKDRRFPFDSDDPWVSKNQFDGGAIRYLMLAEESGPYPWGPGPAWSMGGEFNKTATPRAPRITFPAGPGVVYDVFDHAIVKPTTSGKTSTVTADMRLYPGRLFAIAPAPLGAPRVAAGVKGDTLWYRVEVVDASGKALPARVPLRLRLKGKAASGPEFYRGTGADGTLAAEAPLPGADGPWALEVAELLGGKVSVVDIAAAAAPLGKLLVARPEVEPLRESQLRDLLKAAGGKVTLVVPKGASPSPRQRRDIATALQKRGVALSEGSLPETSSPGVYLAIGHLAAGEESLGALLNECANRGLFPYPASPEVPGPGRGFFAPAFAPRGEKEHCIALVGGNAEGLEKTIDAFVLWLNAPEKPRGAGGSKATAPAMDLKGRPADGPSVPTLAGRVGPKLSGVTAQAKGKRLVVTAEGYLKNLALVEDQGRQAVAVRADRIGQGPAVESAYLSADGSKLGGSCRDTNRVGQAFHLIAADGARHAFGAFGDAGRETGHFAATAAGDLVLATGPYGVVCWKRTGDSWKEAWAIDGWKDFDKLDWPVANYDERAPKYQAFLPDGADHALILYHEAAGHHWLGGQAQNPVWVAAVSLADGKERWRFDVPIRNNLLIPTLYQSPDGSRNLLDVKDGPDNLTTHRFYILDKGKARGTWASPYDTRAAAIDPAAGQIAVAYDHRLLEVRKADGGLVLSRIWPEQPLALAFAPDGKALYLADETGGLTRLDADGREAWRVELGALATLATRGDRIYAAGRDGRLRAFGPDGKAAWALDLSPALVDADPMGLLARSAEPEGTTWHRPSRPPTTSAKIPAGPNLLRDKRATLTVGGTPGFQSEGLVQVKPEDLTNGRDDDVTTPWLNLDELYWDAATGRQVWAEIAFPKPTDVHALTVRENPKFPESWPTEGLVQLWDAENKTWKTAAMGLFLQGPVNTYPLKLKGVTKLRYLPWKDYYRNFHTSEIEVR